MAFKTSLLGSMLRNRIKPPYYLAAANDNRRKCGGASVATITRMIARNGNAVRIDSRSELFAFLCALKPWQRRAWLTNNLVKPHKEGKREGALMQGWM